MTDDTPVGVFPASKIREQNYVFKDVTQVPRG